MPYPCHTASTTAPMDDGDDGKAHAEHFKSCISTGSPPSFGETNLDAVLRRINRSGPSTENEMDTSTSPHQYREQLRTPQSADHMSLLSAVHPVLDDTGVERYYCKMCSFSGESRRDLLAHVDSHYERRCDLCGYTSRTEGRLKQHIQRFHGATAAEHNIADDDDDESPTNCTPTDIDEESTPRFDFKPGPSTTPGLDNITNPTPSGSGSSIRSASKRRTHRCKQCEFTCETKTELWRHARGHIKEEKRLDCPRPNCEFVTEFKHHMEYHIRNHFNSKPYKCSKCNYTCVNKSMLNSHKKSHTNIYQYRCADCTYATKYCHSLKLHLRKYNHKPAAILNLDGTVDHDTSSLLVMKKSGPKGSKTKDKLEQQVNVKPPQTAVVSQASCPPTSSSVGFPMARPPTSFMPFWNMRGPVVPTPSPLMPLSMGSLFRGVFPPSLLPQQIPGNLRMDSSTMSGVSHTDSSTGRGENTVNIQSNSPAHPYRTNGFDMAGMMGRRMMLPFRPQTMLPSTAAAGLPWPELNPSHGRDNMQRQPSSESSQSDENGIRSRTPSIPGEPVEPNMEAPLDLTKAATHTRSPISLTPTKRRLRKGKAHKLDALCLKLQERADASKNERTSLRNPKPTNSSPESDVLRDPSTNSSSIIQTETTEQNNNLEARRVSPLQEKEFSQNGSSTVQPTGNVKPLPVADDHGLYNCPYCEVAFKNCIMYTVHMGYHGYSNPFRCNMCGEESDDKVSFFLHIARAAHK